MKKILFIREGVKISQVFGDYGLTAKEVNTGLLEGTARQLAELVFTTHNLDDTSKVFIRGSEESIELKRKEGKTLSVTEEEKKHYGRGKSKGKSIIVWKWDNLGLEETPEDYFNRHGGEIDRIGAEVLGNYWRRIEEV